MRGDFGQVRYAHGFYVNISEMQGYTAVKNHIKLTKLVISSGVIHCFFQQQNQTPSRAIKSRKISSKPQSELAILNLDIQKAQRTERIEIIHGEIAQNEEAAPR